jgi:hypothetical protein
VENQQQRPFPKARETETALTEKQIERKNKTARTRQKQRGKQFVLHRRFVRGSHSIHKQSTNTNDEERQNRNIKGCFWVKSLYV